MAGDHEHVHRCQDCDHIGGPSPVAGDGLDRIAAERRRQVEVEGWTPAHDDEHHACELAMAADAYVYWAVGQVNGACWLWGAASPASWPWADDWWKPSHDPIRNMEKAGALIAAEIDRLLRARSGGEA